MTGRDTPAEPAKALTFLRRACDGKNAQACGDLGYLYMRGEGVARDPGMARRLFKQSCDGGYAQACKMLSD
jgi:TPR repeat protein